MATADRKGLRSSSHEMFCKKCVSKNLIKFIRKSYAGVTFKKVASLRLAILRKKRLQHRCFPMNFANPFAYYDNFLSNLFLRVPFPSPFTSISCKFERFCQKTCSSVKERPKTLFKSLEVNFFCHFHVPFFYIFLTPKNYKLGLLKSFLGCSVLHYYYFCNI